MLKHLKLRGDLEPIIFKISKCIQIRNEGFTRNVLPFQCSLANDLGKQNTLLHGTIPLINQLITILSLMIAIMFFNTRSWPPIISQTPWPKRIPKPTNRSQSGDIFTNSWNRQNDTKISLNDADLALFVKQPFDWVINWFHGFGHRMCPVWSDDERWPI